MKNCLFSKINIALCSMVLSVAGAHAALLASDNASNAVYSPSWDASDNGGSGFSSWSFANTGGGGRYVGSTALGANSFGVYAGGGSGNTSSVSRSFTGALTSAQTFSLNLATTGIASGGEVGINLTAGGVTKFTLKFVGGGTNWLLNDGGSDFATTLGFSSGTAISFAFKYNGGSGYDIVLVEGATTYSGLGYTATNVISGIDGFKVFSNNQGGGENVGFNNLSIVPEPSTLGLMIVSSLGVVLLMRRRHCF